MPIFVSEPITVFDQEQFHAVDKVATGLAFDIHNEMGRYLDECLYQAELAARLLSQGIQVVREVKITVKLDGFTREYFVDFLVNGGVIIESKTAEALTPAHRAQVLNYLFLCGLFHATLLNFRPERVEHEFVSTSLTDAGRKRVHWETELWQPLSKRCKLLRDTLNKALLDWGSGLDPLLYREVVTHFLGGESAVVNEVEVRSAHGPLGKQKVHLLAPDIAFSVTSAVHHPAAVLEHHRRFLAHTPLRAIHWVNLNRQNITLHTITK